METSKRKSVAPFYAVAALWIVSGLLLPLYTVGHYILLAVVSAVVFFVVPLHSRSASTRIQSAPDRVSCHAQRMPAIPPPMTKTSVLMSVCSA